MPERVVDLLEPVEVQQEQPDRAAVVRLGTPEQIVAAALAEDADAVGLSVLSGAHMTQFRRVVALLQEADADDIVVFGGGIIPAEDIAELAQIGVTGIFTPGAATATIVEWLRAQVASRLGDD